MAERKPIVSELIRIIEQRGVYFPNPAAVEIAGDVSPARIAPGVVIHAGCRIRGAGTWIGPGCVIGEEGPASIDNCRLEENVRLKGGYFAESVFLNGAQMGSGSHVRPGTLLEEESSGAHCVGLKQTVFLSYVTAGSLINACDMLVAGGTNRRDHSEIGSSFVHFNFTPHGDKATPSLIGDVPRGVMLDQRPIFLGGQGGVVGPSRIEYGCVTPAGVIHRGDALTPNQILFPASKPEQGPKPYDMAIYGRIRRVILNNLIYIGNIRALEAWYMFARRVTLTGSEFSNACHQGALEVLDRIIEERIRRLRQLADKVGASVDLLAKQTRTKADTMALDEQQGFIEMWPEMEARLMSGSEIDVGGAARDKFLAQWEKIAAGKSHTDAVAALTKTAREQGSAWLRSLVDATVTIFE